MTDLALTTTVSNQESSRARGIEKQVRDLMKLSYPVELIDEEGQFTASYPDLPGCVSFGDTPDKAVLELNQVKELWIRGQLESGNAIPRPSSYEEKFSGKFVLRIPKLLHHQLHHEAEQQGVSLNQYIIFSLAKRHSAPAPIEIDYHALSQQIALRLRDTTSFKQKYFGHVAEGGKHFHLSGPDSDLDQIGYIWQPADLISRLEPATFSKKEYYREVHSGE